MNRPTPEERAPGAQGAASSPAGDERAPSPVRRGPAVSARSYAKDRAQLLRRLARMEGQVRGIARMVEREESCIDILQQTAALRAAVDAVTLMLLEDHVAGCLTTAVRTGHANAYAEEVMEVVRRSMGRPARPTRSSGES